MIEVNTDWRFKSQVRKTIIEKKKYMFITIETVSSLFLVMALAEIFFSKLSGSSCEHKKIQNIKKLFKIKNYLKLLHLLF